MMLNNVRFSNKPSIPGIHQQFSAPTSSPQQASKIGKECMSHSPYRILLLFLVVLGACVTIVVYSSGGAVWNDLNAQLSYSTARSKDPQNSKLDADALTVAMFYALNTALERESTLDYHIKEAQNAKRLLHETGLTSSSFQLVDVQNKSRKPSVVSKRWQEGKAEVLNGRVQEQMESCIIQLRKCQDLEKRWTIASLQDMWQKRRLRELSALVNSRKSSSPSQSNLTSNESMEQNTFLEYTELKEAAAGKQRKMGSKSQEHVTQENVDSCRAVLIDSCAFKSSGETKGGGMKIEKKLTSEMLWRRDRNLKHRKPHVIFSMQYFKHPLTAELIAESLYKCTNGALGTGQVPGVTSQLVVHVDEPSGWKMWQSLREKTKSGDFIKLIFSYNLHETRGQNRIAQVTDGEFLVFLQDDKVPPENCSWLPDVLNSFASWPRLAAIGLWKGSMSHAQPLDGSELWNQLRWWRDSQVTEDFHLFDPATKVRMHFLSHANIGPMAFRRAPYEEVGGLDEFHAGAKGETGMFHDEDVCIRLWLAGYQVGQIFVSTWFSDGPEPGGTHVGASMGAYTRRQNHYLNEESFSRDTLGDLAKVLESEVMRMNSKLDTNPWPQHLT